MMKTPYSLKNMTKPIILLLCMHTIAFAKANYQIVPDQSNLALLNPSLQKRKTAKLRLSNGLEAYLISDELADQSAAALVVQAGSWNEPKEYPGIAHFLEHMLFSGTKKYPDENAFLKFVTDHGGQRNAYTTSDRTMYCFSVHNQAFDQAIDYFAHFFIDPLFSPSAVAREVHAVDQEYAQNIENDEWRKVMIRKELGNPDHPYQGFNVGNMQTLAQIPEHALRTWYEANYSANLMKLVIYSPKPLERLIEEITQNFSQIPNKNIEPLAINKPLSSNAQLGHFIYIEPVKNTQRLSLEWELPASWALDETKAADLLAYIIDQRGKNSLFELLKKEGLAESLRVSTEKVGHHNLFFSINITLTDQGVRQIPIVIQRCFEALSVLCNAKIPAYLFQEVANMKKISYQHQTREDAFAFVQSHARHILYESLATYPAKTLLPSAYDPEKVQGLLQVLQPENCQYYILAQPVKTKVQPDRKEKWLGGGYAVRPVPAEHLQAWKNISPHPNISLPKPNSFIPSKLTLLPKDKNVAPLKIVDNKHGKAFYCKDNAYTTSKVVHLMHIKSPLIDGTARSATLMDLYIQFIKDKLSSLLSCAAYAGLQVDFEHIHNALKITLSGFSDKASYLLKELLKELIGNKPQATDFNLYCAHLSNHYKNTQKSWPISQAVIKLSSTLEKKPLSNEQLVALHSLTYQDFLHFHSKLFEKSYTEAFFSGNLTIKEAKSCWRAMSAILGSACFPKHLHPKRQVLCLADQGPFVVEEQTTAQGNGIILAIDHGTFSFEKQAAHAILSTVLEEAFFTTLRTKQKTGYIAQSSDKEIEKRLFQYFLVQSNSHSCQELLYRFELFLDLFLQEMRQDISLERFEKIRKNYLRTLEKPLPNLQDKTGLLAWLAFEHHEDFTWLQKRIKAAKMLTYEIFLKYAEQLLARKNRKRLAVCVSGKLPEASRFSYKTIDPAEILKWGKYVTAAD